MHFSAQLKEALAIGQAASIRPADREIRNILVAGMGGSGIGADFVASFIREECAAPFFTLKDYDAPAWVGPHTLFIASSYSGNTEETLSACRQAAEKGARIVAITSGGDLQRMASERGWDIVSLPKGQPAPRACLGYSLVAQLWALRHLGLTGAGVLEQISKAAEMLEAMQQEIQDSAAQIARFLQGKIAVIYTTGVFEPAALRFRQQLAENAKTLSWHGIVPEINHNELVGWRRDQPSVAALFLRHPGETDRIRLRMNFTRELVEEFAAARMEIFAKGNSAVEQVFYLIHLLDWASLFLAQIQGLDPMEIQIIDLLKEKMAGTKQ